MIGRPHLGRCTAPSPPIPRISLSEGRSASPIPGIPNEMELLETAARLAGAWLASLTPACRNLVPAFPQRSPPSLLTTAACGGLRSTPDCRPRRALLHLSYSCAPPRGSAVLVTQDPIPTSSSQVSLPSIRIA